MLENELLNGISDILIDIIGKGVDKAEITGKKQDGKLAYTIE